MKLQLTNNFRPYFDQISRILQYLLTQSDRSRISRNELVSVLGLSDRHVKHICNVTIEFGLMRSRFLILTEIGKIIAKKDGFFDRLETLWFAHYSISSNSDWVVWHRVVKDVIPNNETLKIVDVARDYFSDLSAHFSEKTLEDKLPKEIGVVLWTYANSKLARLALLRQEKTGEYLRGTPVNISPLAFLTCILTYRDRYTEGATAMTVHELIYGENSPGVILNLSESQVRSLFDAIHDTGLIRLEKFGDLDQVRFGDGDSVASVLEMIY